MHNLRSLEAGNDVGVDGEGDGSGGTVRVRAGTVPGGLCRMASPARGAGKHPTC
jgi:hypothetical protein